MTTQAKYITLPEIDKAIGRIETRCRNTFKELHVINMSILAHVAEHGDYTVAEERVARITKIDGITKGKVTKWFEAFMHGEFDKGSWSYDEGASHRDINLEQADAVMWHHFKADPKVTPAKTLAQLLDYVEKQGKKSVTDEVLTQAQLDFLRKAFLECAALEGEITTAEVTQLAEAS